jgi:hypothetical protein
MSETIKRPIGRPLLGEKPLTASERGRRTRHRQKLQYERMTAFVKWVIRHSSDAEAVNRAWALLGLNDPAESDSPPRPAVGARD